MKILVGMESSGVVRSAFKKLGHDAWSLDLLPADDGSKFHIQDDILNGHLNDNWDLAILHPPCFSGETLIRTRNGFEEICKIKEGDQVLTHKGRWRKVTKVMQRNAEETLVIKVSGSFPIRTTKEHPFFIKTRTWKFINKLRTRVESEPRWEAAGNLKKRDLIGSVISPEERSSLDNNLLWLMGRYVADGHLRFRGGNVEAVHFSVGKAKIQEFRETCQLKFSEIEKRTAILINMYGREFCEQFVQFGRGAENKKLPDWVLNLPEDQASHFLNGYLSGDGYINEKRISAASISKVLILGIGVLMRRVYKKTFGVNKTNRKPTTVIEGRIVNQKASLSVYCHFGNNTLASIDNNYTWNVFRSAEIEKGCIVYNLSVEEDESYMAENCIAHNCTDLSSSGARWFPQKIADGSQQKSIDFFMAMINAPIPRIAVENPIGIMSTRYRKPNQIIQPWWFGDPAFKGTCLWLKNLPNLVPTNKLTPPAKGTEEYKKWSAIHFCPPGPDRWKIRSKSFQGIADGMASQWSKLP